MRRSSFMLKTLLVYFLSRLSKTIALLLLSGSCCLAWSTNANRTFVAVVSLLLLLSSKWCCFCPGRVAVVRVGEQNVAVVQETKRNQYITAWISTFTRAWAFSEFDCLMISLKQLVART